MGVVDLIEKGLFLEQTNDKFCADCKTTKTPLWRGGPAGPKSLCNACGIRYRKRKESTVGMRRRTENKRDKTLFHATTCSSSQKTISKSDVSESENAGGDRRFQMRTVGYGKAVLLKKQASGMEKQRWQKQREIGEDAAAAAVSLMALSCDSVIA